MSEQGEVHKPAPRNSTIPVKLLHDPSAKDGTVRLYAHMYWRYGQNKKNFEGQRSVASYLKVSSKTISNRTKELEYLDWLIVIERDFNAKTGNYQTNYYHLFLDQNDCRKFRAEYQVKEGERMRPKPPADEVDLRVSRAGKGNPQPHHAKPSSDGHKNLSSADQRKPSSDELIPSYLSTDTYVSESTFAPQNSAVKFTLYDKPAAPGNISDKKWTADRPVHLLGMALEIPATDGDWSNYKAVANKLIASGIEPDQFGQYVQWVRQIAAGFSQPWEVTLNSLVSAGRVSKYMTWKANGGAIKPRGQQPTDMNEGIVFATLEDILGVAL